ncbi:DUF412 family protein, partial [Salmonella enterica subsp. enterica serovar Kentucky]|nr:DUF412 family protein [Salmonella enterica subsp. enterica serovar Kentucky]
FSLFRRGQHYAKTWPMEKRLAPVFVENRVIRMTRYAIRFMPPLDEVGVVGFKCFVATCGDRGIDNDFRDVNDWQFYKGAQKLGE